MKDGHRKRAAPALLLAALLPLLIPACVSTAPPRRSVIRDSSAGKADVVSVQEGKASWYGRQLHGRRTASGERFDMHALTAAHRSLRMQTRVRVTNLRNGRHVLVRINDRGPYSKGRIIDLSYAAARALDMITAGVVPVRVEALAP